VTDPQELLIAAIAAVSNAGLTTNLVMPLVLRAAVLLRAFDHPDPRKHQREPVPRLGGVAMVIGIAVGAGGLAMLYWGSWGIAIGRSELVAFAIGTGMVFLLGVVDDLAGVGPFKKLLVELAAAWLLVRVGWAFTVLWIPGVGNVELGVWGGVLSLVWIVGVTNAVNLLDGLDGLAGGVVAIIASSLVVYALLQQNPLSVILLGATAGACVGFLRHNWEPARIFMGDSGSLTLGFILAVMTVHSSLKGTAAVAILIPVLALGLPVIDTLLVMAVRFLDRPRGAVVERFLGMFHADRNHLHHALMRVGARRSRIVQGIYLVAACFCAFALLVATTRNVALGLVLVALEFAVILGMRNLGMVVEARELSRRKRDELRDALAEEQAAEQAAAAAADGIGEAPGWENVRPISARADRR
jgi:UDP-GlcNAc:undecaprenyl-phosphate GlcNAc-1-phosphate transferase